MNLLHKPCVTVRFSTDRPETIMNIQNNLLAPPISGAFFAKTVDAICSSDSLLQTMRKQPSLYGDSVGNRFMTIVQDLMKHRKPMSWAHDDFALIHFR